MYMGVNALKQPTPNSLVLCLKTANQGTRGKTGLVHHKEYF